LDECLDLTGTTVRPNSKKGNAVNREQLIEQVREHTSQSTSSGRLVLQHLEDCLEDLDHDDITEAALAALNALRRQVESIEGVVRKPDMTKVYERALAELPDKVQLVDVEYDDQLRDEQIQKLFDGDELSVFEELDEGFADSRHYGMEYVLNDVLGDDRALLERHAPELAERLRDEINERDESDALGDLLRRSGSRLVRYRLGGEDDYDLEPNSWSWDEDEIEEAAKALAETAGVPYEGDNVLRFRSLVVEASYGGVLEVIWYADVEDLYKALEFDGEGKPTAVGTITWTDPDLLVLDAMNGSGHNEAIKGQISVPFDPSRLTLDSQGWGYGWDKIAGVVHSAYACEWSITKDTEQEQA
jgi:hypothetical protein